MIKIENTDVYGWEAAIRGMRNPMNSWDKSDSEYGCYISNCEECDESTYRQCYCSGAEYKVGGADHDLMLKLASAGPVHGKYRRMITVTVDITAPLYWWKEFDTYKVGTVANSCSTMHKIHDKEFTMDDFSHEHVIANKAFCWENDLMSGSECNSTPLDILIELILALNVFRAKFLETGDKKYWWQMIQLLPSSYNQKRTVQLNYEVLASIYEYRRNHKLDEWHTLCDWILALPYSEIITCNCDSVTTCDS